MPPASEREPGNQEDTGGRSHRRSRDTSGPFRRKSRVRRRDGRPSHIRRRRRARRPRSSSAAAAAVPPRRRTLAGRARPPPSAAPASPCQGTGPPRCRRRQSGSGKTFSPSPAIRAPCPAHPRARRPGRRTTRGRRRIAPPRGTTTTTSRGGGPSSCSRGPCAGPGGAISIRGGRRLGTTDADSRTVFPTIEGWTTSAIRPIRSRERRAGPSTSSPGAAIVEGENGGGGETTCRSAGAGPREQNHYILLRHVTRAARETSVVPSAGNNKYITYAFAQGR